MTKVKSDVKPAYKRGNAKFSIVLLGMAYMFWFLVNPNDPNKGHYAVIWGYELWTPVPFMFYLVFLPVRVLAAVWISRVVVTMNRSSFIWAIFALLFPIVALGAVNYLTPDQDFSTAKAKWRIIRKRINGALAVLSGLAILAFLVSVILKPTNLDMNYLRKTEMLLLVITLKIATVTWVKRLAFGKNRNHTRWGLAACLCSSLPLIVIGFLPKIAPKAPSASRPAKVAYTTIISVLTVVLLIADVHFLRLLNYDDWYGPGNAERNERAYREMGEHRIRVYQKKRCGALDMFGREKIPCYYQYIGQFSKNGLAPVKQFDKWGYIEKNGIDREGKRTGKPIIPCEYDSVKPFDDVTGLAQVRMFGSEEWEGIDRAGNLLIPIEKNSASPAGEAQPALPEDTIPTGEQPTGEQPQKEE